MLKVHNTKVNKITAGYREYVELRERSKTEGIPFEELKAQAAEEAGEPVKKAKKAKKGGKKKKKLAAGFGGACDILMKDKDGNIINYDSNDDLDQADEPTEDATAVIEVEAPKKKVKKTEVNEEESALDMLKNALNKAKSGLKKTKISKETMQKEGS